ncbi:MAG TPA: peroxiredoxin [Gammaproteobacteria bacterium]|nr:peroxiredoxin [Gammaproteobacteria bacterium]
MLKVGDIAPDFSLPDHAGKTVSLRELLAQGPVLLYFYPADFTPVCTREACAFSAVEPELAKAGVTLIGISPQDEITHARFRERYSLPFPLLADPEKQVIRAYDCNGPLGFGVSRVTYLIGKDGLIQEATKAALRVAPHLDLAKRAASSPK